jgi:hypothetical protein
MNETSNFWRISYLKEKRNEEETHLRHASLVGLEEEPVHVGHLHLIVIKEQQLSDSTSEQENRFFSFLLNNYR